MAAILKIKKSHRGENEWILYNPDNFKLHTHCYSLRVAIAIKKNVERLRIPKSRNLQTLYSHLRVVSNKVYREKIQLIIDEVLQHKDKEL